MLVAHVIFSVSQENRPLALDTLTNEVATVRAMEGCVAFVPFVDPTNNEDIGVLHEWAEPENFTTYLQSESFATIGTILRPLMTSPPVSKRFDATPLET